MDTKFIDIDVGRPLPARIDVPEQSFVKAIVWLHGRPLGIVTVTCRGGHVYRRGLARAIIRQLADPILRELVRNGMATPGMQSLELDDLLKLPPVEEPVEPSQLTVVICTTGRYWDALEHCLQSLALSPLPRTLQNRHSTRAESYRSKWPSRGSTPLTMRSHRPLRQRGSRPWPRSSGSGMATCSDW